MSDDMLRALARNGGVIQMNMVSDYLRLNKPKVAAMQALLARYRNAASADDKRAWKRDGSPQRAVSRRKKARWKTWWTTLTTW
jgi:microsomal dipeptidase-like Zn-dependent dipeptidase